MVLKFQTKIERSSLRTYKKGTAKGKKKAELKICVDRLVEDYAEDFDENLYAEIEHLYLYLKNHFNTEATQLSYLDLYKLIKKQNKWRLHFLY